MMADLPTEAFERWLDGTADDTARRQVAEYLHDSAATTILLDHLHLATLLRHTLQPKPPGILAQQVRALMAARRPEHRQMAMRVLRHRLRSRRHRWSMAALMAAALMVVVVGWWWWPVTDRRPCIAAGGGRSGDNMPLQAGDHVPTATRISIDQPLTLRWPDASTLTFIAASSTRIEQDGVWLDDGHVDAAIMHRAPASPFHVRTRHATVTVIGTRFSVTAHADRTTVAVTAGMVRVANKRGEERTMTSGDKIIANADGWIARPASAPSTPIAINPNHLTQQERDAGWRLLFDGISTAGWRGLHAASIPPVWTVRDGTLQRIRKVGVTDGIVDDLATTDEFGDFDLRFEWRMSAGGNSGVLYRAGSGMAQAHDTAPEYQLVDTLRHPDGRTMLTWPGSCYALYPPSRDLAAPIGEWNRGRIVARGKRVEHWLNDTVAVTYTLLSDDWLARVAKSKFARLPRYGREPVGRIVLQDHGNAVAFRSLKILPLQ